ncbi:hypothetical protein TH59_11415 [Pantoea ananatis]|mgnify:CR=1 FL=1|jgi:hypothetical protein|nr:hypothetical protein AW734_00245 [Pantoea ananatis]PKC47976.1 hypothetical protein V461_00345 [Pantoea ananatis BRT98]CCF08180.1 hypothetical protein PANA5342_0787 [Pantoea ananatis LMG 5342]MDC7865811.1 hypothetical protein [Pantoea ananatis]MDC7870778.1 hypothetical protein [Pantoea ananatis]
MDPLWFIASGVGSEPGLLTGKALFSLMAKIQVQQAINPVNALMVPAIALHAQHLKKLLKPYRG